MVIKLNHQELQQMITEAVKRVEEERLSPTDVFAGLIWHYCINSQDHIYKGEYYDLPVIFKYDTDGVSLLEVNYLSQENQWVIFRPDYEHTLRTASLVLKWLDETYLAYVASHQPVIQPKSRRRRRKRSSPGPRRRKRAVFQPSSLTMPLSQPQPSPRRATRPSTGNDQRGNQGNSQDNGNNQNNFS